MKLNSPSCDDTCTGRCCEFSRLTTMIGGQQVKVFQAVYLSLALLSVLFWLTRLSTANRALTPLYFRFLLVSMAAYVFVLILHLLPQMGTDSYENILALLYSIGLMLQWFIQTAMIFVMLEKTNTGLAMRWAMGRAACLSVLCFFIWIAGVFTHSRTLTSLGVEVILSIFFWSMFGYHARSTQRKLRPMIAPWAFFMISTHALFFVNYLLIQTIPVSDSCACSEIISYCVYYALYGIVIYYCLTGDTRFWKKGGCALLAAYEAGGGGDEEEENTQLLLEESGLGANSGTECMGMEREKLATLLSHLDRSLAAIDRDELEFEKAVGQGQFGVVHRARFRHEIVAVKEFKVNNSDWSDAVSSLIQETSILSRLSHPSIVRAVGVCLAPPSPSHCPSCMLVTEFVHGGSLYDLIRTSRPEGARSGALDDWKLRLKIMTQLSEAVAYMHSRSPPLLHRDIKSPNILLTSNGPDMEVKLCDFGVSRVMRLTATMTSCGTPQWMAPELLRGERYGEASDVYSLGVVFWEICSLSRPFEGIPPMRVISLVAYEGVELPPLSSSTPKNIHRVTRECLRRKPESRIAAKDIAARLLDLPK